MIVAIVGATGTGKSAASLALAAQCARLGVEAEIVNADAMQLYRGMDIGTAKLEPQERRGIAHHLLDVLDVTEEASVAAYQRDARAAVEDIAARGRIPIVVGGSGLYLAALLTDFRFPGTDPAIRARWEALYARSGLAEVHAELERRDPQAAAAIGPHNARRIIRALEVNELTGGPATVGQPGRATPWRPHLQLEVTVERAALVARLNSRVEAMWARGLLDEVRTLQKQGIERGVTASRAIGYSQALRQLPGSLSEREAIEQTAALTRRYARRQVSWFRRDSGIERVDGLDPDAVDARLASAAQRAVDSMGA
jgi:tRNA dimethylallyltransferase